MKRKNKNNGITLIALIITIIVMLILVGVSISMVVNGGLFKYAGKAVGDTGNAIDKEQAISEGKIKIGDIYYTIDEYLEQVTQNNNSRIKLSYTVKYSEDNTSAVITVTAKMLGNYLDGYEDYYNWAEKQIEGKTEEEIEQIFVEGANYWNKLDNNGEPEYNNINELVAYWAESYCDNRFDSVEGMVEDYGYETLYDMAIDWWSVYPEKYEFWEYTSYYVYAKKQLAGKTEEEIEQIFVEGANYWNKLNNDGEPEYNNINELVAYWAENYDNNQYSTLEDMLECCGFETLSDMAIDYSYVKPEDYGNLQELIGHNIVNIIDPEGIIWDNVNTKKYTVALSGEYKFVATNETGTESNSIVVNIETVPNPNEKFSEIYTKNTKITETADGKTYKAVIPKGFAVGTSSNINSIANGLVITDKVNSEGQSIGNEFVWIPVTYEEEGTLDEDGYDTGFKKSFYRSTWGDNGRDEDLTNSTQYIEPLTSGGYEGEAKDYKEMLDSVYQNGGFYIGRYEAGSTTPRTNKANGTTKMIVKRDAYPYTYVGWGSSMTDYTSDVIDNNKNQGKGALYLSKAMYAKENVGVTSTLCYGIMWDAMVDFIKDKLYDVNLMEWGNTCIAKTWEVTRGSSGYSKDNGETWKFIINEEEIVKNKQLECMLLTTGADDSLAAKNIYDVSGNVKECSNEFEYYERTGNSYRVARGSDIYSGLGGESRFYKVYSRYYSNNRFVYMIETQNSIEGFRPALYIKNNA